MLSKLSNDVKENVKINNTPHGTRLMYFQNLGYQVNGPFNMQPSLCQTLNGLTAVLTTLRNNKIQVC
jgi:hypothetical protein